MNVRTELLLEGRLNGERVIVDRESNDGRIGLETTDAEGGHSFILLSQEALKELISALIDCDTEEE